MIEAMIDIETVDNTTSSAVFQIGYIIFDDSYTILKEGLLHIDIQPQFNIGRTASASTLAFWTDPKISGTINESLSITKDNPDFHHKHVLSKLTSVCSQYDIKNFWAKGDFDYRILNDLYESIGPPYWTPWKYFQIRELRTMMKECGVKPSRAVSHNAHDDCVNQLESLTRCREIMSKGRNL